MTFSCFLWQVYQDEIANLQLPLTHMKTLPATDSKSMDALLCAGNFNALAVILDGKVCPLQKVAVILTNIFHVLLM